MDSGVAELEAYRRFGERCGQMKYKTFSTILIQNLQKGGHRMADLLEKEALEAWEKEKKCKGNGGNSSNKVACSNDHDACGGDGDHHDTCIFVVLWMIV